MWISLSVIYSGMSLFTSSFISSNISSKLPSSTTTVSCFSFPLEAFSLCSSLGIMSLSRSANSSKKRFFFDSSDCSVKISSNWSKIISSFMRSPSSLWNVNLWKYSYRVSFDLSLHSSTFFILLPNSASYTLLSSSVNSI